MDKKYVVMEIENRNTVIKKIILVIFIVIAVVALGYTSYAYFIDRPSTDDKGSANSDQSENTNAQATEQDTDAKNKQDFLDAQKDTEENTTPPETDSASKPTISIDIKDEQNGTVTIFTKLVDVPSGSCTLTIKNGTTQKSYTAAVIYQPDYSSCAGFSVSKTDIGSGTWAVQLEVEVDGNRYTKEATTNII
jgi:hypothetical protein